MSDEEQRIISGQSMQGDESIDRAMRPARLQDYVGQGSVKKQMEIFIEAARSRKDSLDHVLIFGPPGLGKTTLSHIIANELGVDISDLPVGASSPEWYSEKAAAIGLYAVSCGIYTHLGHPPNILGSETVTNLAVEGLEGLVGATFAIEPDPNKAAELFDARIRAKRQALGLPE